MTATPIPPRHHRPDHDNNDHHDDHNTNDNHGNAYIFYYNIIDGFDEYDGCGGHATSRRLHALASNNSRFLRGLSNSSKMVLGVGHPPFIGSQQAGSTVLRDITSLEP